MFADGGAVALASDNTVPEKVGIGGKAAQQHSGVRPMRPVGCAVLTSCYIQLSQQNNQLQNQVP